MITKRDLIKRAGSGAELARTMGISRQAVQQMPERSLPAKHVLAVYWAFDGEFSPHQLRPDIYPDPEWRPRQSYDANDCAA